MNSHCWNNIWKNARENWSTECNLIFWDKNFSENFRERLIKDSDKAGKDIGKNLQDYVELRYKIKLKGSEHRMPAGKLGFQHALNESVVVSIRFKTFPVALSENTLSLGRWQDAFLETRKGKRSSHTKRERPRKSSYQWGIYLSFRLFISHSLRDINTFMSSPFLCIPHPQLQEI